MTTILWAIAAAVFFGVTNAFSYKRGYNGGFNTGVEVKIKKVRKGEYVVELEEEE